MKVKLLPAKSITTIGIGGVYRVYFPKSIREIVSLMDRENFYLIGGGSNIVLSEDVSDLLNLVSLSHFNTISVEGDNIRVGAGTRVSEVIRFLIDNKLSSIEFLAGIPKATVGGAVSQNAGAFGVCMKDLLVEVVYIDSEGKKLKIMKDFDEFSYRQSPFPDKGVVVEIVISVKPSNNIWDIVRSVVNDRLRKQPPFWLMSAGSVFKNPQNAYAGYLIESVGLKGTRFGDIEISDKHANFFINRGTGSFSDFSGLLSLVRNKVMEKYGLFLEPEVKTPGVNIES